MNIIESSIVLTLTLGLACLGFQIYPNIQKQRSQLVRDDLFHYLQYARSEAIKKNHQITLCGTKDGETCHPSWDQGFLLRDKDHIIRVKRYDNQPNLKISGFFNHAIDNQIDFKPTGQSSVCGRLIIQDGNNKKTLVLYQSGRVRFG